MNIMTQFNHNRNSMSSCNELDFNSMNHAQAVNHLIHKLKDKQKLTFAEQCAMFMVTLAQHPVVMTRETVIAIDGNTEIWDEIQPLVSSVAQAFPTAWQMSLSEAGAYMCGLNADGTDKPQKNKNSPAKKLVCKTYIVRKQGTHEVKIGKSIHVEKRIRTLETQSGTNLEVLTIIPKDIEAMLHKQFCELRTVGEWFDDSQGLIAAFAAKQGGAA